jgi:serine/threonine-protein kinase
MDLAGYVLKGRYVLDRHVADGGMGAVWSAREIGSGSVVAVKLMRVEWTSRADLRARFEQEALAARRLDDPHVVRVLDHGTEDDTPFIVMELLDGVDLFATWTHARTWPCAEVAELVCQVAAGLSAAHRAGIVHRDVKPGNIFLVRGARTGFATAKLIDFGIAKWDEHGQVRTATNVALGSPSYMSPEQVRGERIDARVDAWALAVVAFSLLVGDLPFVGKNGPEIAKHVVLGQRRAVPANLPFAGRLEWFFSRAFAAPIGSRFGSVDELASAFVEAVGERQPLRTAANALDAASHPIGGAAVDSGGGDDETAKLMRGRAVPAGSSTEPLPRASSDLDDVTVSE